MTWKYFLRSQLSRKEEAPLISIEALEDDQNPRKKQDSFLFESWRLTLCLGSLASTIVLLFNIGFVAWAVQHHTLQNGRGILYEGECARAKNMSTAFHLAINILATALLSASNYGMQCISAPTRDDIDRAHKRGRWLDIGVQSVRNLSAIPRKKTILWICLALSSLPLHLVYNSTIFLTTAAYQYNVYVGNAPFSSYDAQTVRFPTMEVTSDMETIETSPSFETLQNSEMEGRFQRLDNSKCISAYATNFQMAHSNVLIITDDNITSYDFDLISFQLVSAGGSDSYDWICSGLPSSSSPCSSAISDILSRADEWVVAGTNGSTGVANNYRVKYCLSEEAVERCKVEYHLPLAIVVNIFTVIKAIILCIIALSNDQSPILTTGDAVAGFMRRPDRFTSAKMPLSRKGVKAVVQRPWVFSAARRPWGSAVPVLQKTICFGLYAASVSLCIGLLVYAFSDVDYNSAILWTSGLGAAVQQFLIHGNRAPTSFAPNILIANLPQTIFSLIHFCTNRVFTTMALTVEWSSYAIRRKGLRVSTSPQGAQRSSYFLSLPYRYAVPFMGLSTLLHWLISQSLFLVSVELYDSDFNRRPDRDIMTCGYSPVGVVSGLSGSVFMVVCLIGIMCFKQFESGMPVAGSCSLAISAACHPYVSAEGGDMEHPGVEYLPLQWGVVPGPFGTAEHCSFSSEEVGMPEDGHMYE